MPEGHHCPNLRQFHKRYGIAFRIWSGEPLYWIYAKCNISVQALLVTAKSPKTIRIFHQMNRKFMIYCFPQHFEDQKPPQSKIKKDTAKYITMHRTHSQKPAENWRGI
eukprot:2633835-Ditylum_brightwellii.AAC.1